MAAPPPTTAATAAGSGTSSGEKRTPSESESESASASRGAGHEMVPRPTKLHGRAFYESIGSPRMILAPMVDQSEFAWRRLTRSYYDDDDGGEAGGRRRPPLLAYSPMFHARLFVETARYRQQMFQPTRDASPSSAPASASATASASAAAAVPFLDGHPTLDRPLIVQFCAHSADDLLSAAQRVAPHCDAVDLNLGCPQAIARRGQYGAFLQEDWARIEGLIATLHAHLPVPVTAKIRILESAERTLAYARMVLAAGASWLAVHGRQRHQKGHETGLADWRVIRYLREQLGPDVVLFANGNVLRHADLEACRRFTGADAVMSAEGNLCDPAIFAPPPPPPPPPLASPEVEREYWRGPNGAAGYRMDGVMRRYLDIIYRHVLERAPPERGPLFVVGDVDGGLLAGRVDDDDHTAPSPPPFPPPPVDALDALDHQAGGQPPPSPPTQPPAQKRRRRHQPPRDQHPPSPPSPNLRAMQAHLFHLLRPLLSRHPAIRDALAATRSGDMAAYESILRMVERVTADGLIELEHAVAAAADGPDPVLPCWVCQPYVRPLPHEALLNGSLNVGKKKNGALAGRIAAAAAAAAEAEAEAVEAEAGRKAVGFEEEKVVGVVGGGGLPLPVVDGDGDGGVRVDVDVPGDGDEDADVDRVAPTPEPPAAAPAPEATLEDPPAAAAAAATTKNRGAEHDQFNPTSPPRAGFPSRAGTIASTSTRASAITITPTDRRPLRLHLLLLPATTAAAAATAAATAAAAAAEG
ncbi:MAG: hypothetical protein M1826_007766 [Phylliscum demangeonii]|nr:MAG: hypothetical protein M1826_007766 [Phylliscum demangeonii]